MLQKHNMDGQKILSFNVFHRIYQQYIYIEIFYLINLLAIYALINISLYILLTIYIYFMKKLSSGTIGGGWGVHQWEALTCSCDQRANEKPMNIFPQTISHLTSYGGDWRSALAIPGLLNIYMSNLSLYICIYRLWKLNYL